MTDALNNTIVEDLRKFVEFDRSLSAYNARLIRLAIHELRQLRDLPSQKEENPSVDAQALAHLRLFRLCSVWDDLQLWQRLHVMRALQSLGCWKGSTAEVNLPKPVQPGESLPIGTVTAVKQHPFGTEIEMRVGGGKFPAVSASAASDPKPETGARAFFTRLKEFEGLKRLLKKFKR